VRAPETAGVGMATITIAFDAWKAGHVAPSSHEVRVIPPKFAVKLEPVSAQLKGELVHPNRTSIISEIHYSPDGKRIIAGDYPGGVVVVWDVATGKQLTAIETGYGYRGSAQYFFLSPDWQTLYVSRAKRHVERVEKEGKRFLNWTFDGNVRAWDLATGQLAKTFKHQPARGIRNMQLSPDGTRFVTSEEVPGTYEGQPRSAASLWDVQTGQYRTLPDGLQLEKFSPDGGTLAMTTVGHDHALKLFDTATGKEKLSIPIKDANASVFVTAFSPDGRLMMANYAVYAQAKQWDKSRSWLKWWGATTGREVATFAADPNDYFSRSRLSPDGRTLAVTNWQGEKRKLFLFQVPDKQLVKTVVLGEKKKGERSNLSEPAFSPDGKWLALITQALPDTREDVDVHDIAQPRIHLIDVASGEIRETLIAPQAFPWSPCFSPDGRTLATGGSGRVLLWHVPDSAGQKVGARE
jgi:WD40 repeat protein